MASGKCITGRVHVEGEPVRGNVGLFLVLMHLDGSAAAAHGGGHIHPPFLPLFFSLLDSQVPFPVSPSPSPPLQAPRWVRVW